MIEIVVGSQNPGKLREYGQIFTGLPVKLLYLTDVGLGDMDVEETGETFEENARLKAMAYARASGKYAMADDSGLCVEVLDGAPGVYSARYAGPGASDADRRQKLLRELANIPDEERSAYFECVIALSSPDGEQVTVVLGRVTGVITHTESDGTQGFGYDPIFQPDGFDVTFADITKEEKNKISHRGRAAEALIPFLRRLTVM